MSDPIAYPPQASSGQPSGTTTAARPLSLGLRRVIVLIMLAAAAWIGLAPLTAVPDVVPAGAPETAFSAERAQRHLAVIAAEPRPIGSSRNAAVREYIIGQLQVMGYEPQVQSMNLVRSGGGEAHVFPVHNVVARLEGTGDGPALLMSGHYDSVATSTGAGDCGQCAAVVLEAARALRAGLPPGNDIIFLFTDGEEVDVAGAEAFARHHPWAGDVGLSIVFEGYGTDAASMLYVTGQDSGGLQARALAAMSDATRYPLAYSFVHSLMWTLAGNTGSDLDAFLELAPGLGFIYLSPRTSPAYHTMVDSLANLDLRTVQHQGDYAVALAGAFADQPAADASGPDRVMFPLLPGVMAGYSGALALPLAIGAAVALAVVLVAGARRGDWRPGGILAGVGLWLPAFAGSLVVVTAAWWLARRLIPGLGGFVVGGWFDGGWFLTAVLALGLAVVLVLYGLFRRRVAAADLFAGGLVWWALLGLLTAAVLPGWSYLFVWPLLAAILVRPALWGLGSRAGGLGGTILAALPAAVAVWLIAPVLVLLWIYAGRMEAILGVPAGWLPLLVGLWLPVLILPALEPLSARGWTRAGGAAVLASVALLAVAAVVSRPTPDQPATDSITYWADMDAGRAYWITFNDSRAGRGTRGQLDEWTSQFFPGGEDAAEPTTIDPWFNGEMDAEYPSLQSPAPLIERPLSSLERVSGDDDTMTLTFDQAGGSYLTQVGLLATSPIISAAVDGEPLALGPGAPEVLLIIYGATTAPLRIDLRTEAPGPLAARVLDRFAGLPADAGLVISPRPAKLMPAPAPDVVDATIIEHRITLDE